MLRPRMTVCQSVIVQSAVMKSAEVSHMGYFGIQGELGWCTLFIPAPNIMLCWCEKVISDQHMLLPDMVHQPSFLFYHQLVLGVCLQCITDHWPTCSQVNYDRKTAQGHSQT